jgi:hypothetical protein
MRTLFNIETQSSIISIHDLKKILINKNYDTKCFFL